MHPFETRVRAAIQEHHMLTPSEPVLLGLSGGADSAALLHVLLALGHPVSALHVHHGLRGAEADADEAFCRALCKKRSAAYACVRVDTASYAREHGLSVEEAGRALRYAAFTQAANGQKIAVAHHRDDQAETILMRLARGTGTLGLAGILHVRGSIIRPFLDMTRAEIEAYCTENGIAFRTDATNADDTYTRNKIRNTVMPFLADTLNPAIADALARAARLAAEENAALDMFTQAALAQCRDGDSALSIPALLHHPIAIRRRVLRTMAGEAAGLRDVGLMQIDMLLSLCEKQTGKAVSLPRGLVVSRAYDRLVFHTKQAADTLETPLLMGECVHVPALRAAISLSRMENAQNFARKLCTNPIDCDKIKNGLSVRTRRPGDFIVTKGGTKKLKKLWIDSKVPREARETAVLVCDGAEVVWIVGGTVSARYAAGSVQNPAYIELWEEEK